MLDDVFKRPPPVSFDAIAEWVDKVRNRKWTWGRNTRCKYVTIKIDTRSGAYRIEDRDGLPISYDDLIYQYGQPLTPPE